MHPPLRRHQSHSSLSILASASAGGARLSATDAAYAPPIASVWLESPLLSGVMAGMRPCEMDADCASIPNSVCIDLEDQGTGALQVSSSMQHAGTQFVPSQALL